MISIHSVKSKWHYLALLATFIQAFVVYNKSAGRFEDSDVISAIRRAKTEACRKELGEFATRVLDDSKASHLQLRRSCRLDSSVQRDSKVGCLNYRLINDLVKIDEQMVNVSTCLDSCFSYGHSHGGYDEILKCCVCGDSGFQSAINHDITTTVGNCSGVGEVVWYKVNNGIYHPSQQSPPLGRPANGTQVKIAFLLTLRGRSTLHIRRLLANIYSKAHIYYLHIDKRDEFLYSELSSLKDGYSNVIVTESRFNTIWGGPILLRMIIDSIGQLSKHKWDYLINLSESDFPIKPLKALETYLSSNMELIFLKGHHIKGYNFIKKQGLDRNFYQCEDRVWRLGKRLLPRGVIYTGGSDWFALPRDFCLFIRQSLSNSNSLVRVLMQFYNHTLLPAESFFHTVALNTQFCDRYSDNNLRITNWHRKKGCKCQHKSVVDWCGCSPLIYRWSDWGRLERSKSMVGLFFSRKFDPTISSSIISAVERQLVFEEPFIENKTTYDTRFWQNTFTKSQTEVNHSSATHQFGLFVLKQIQLNPSLRNHSLILRSVSQFFNEDRFVGLIHQYCDSSSNCFQLLVVKNNKAHLPNQHNECSSIANTHSLKVIEVNHGFDTGERMFRNYTPLNRMSDVVVYHEWLVDFSKNMTKNITEQLKFSWSNPDVSPELVQSVKLKGASKPTKLSLAHRLSVAKPIRSGLWTLTISRQNKKCLDYRFLVFGDNTFEDEKINQEQFNLFYQVSDLCFESEIEGSGSNLCSQRDWSLPHKSTLGSHKGKTLNVD